MIIEDISTSNENSISSCVSFHLRLNAPDENEPNATPLNGVLVVLIIESDVGMLGVVCTGSKANDIRSSLTYLVVCFRIPYIIEKILLFRILIIFKFFSLNKILPDESIGPLANNR